MNISALYNAHLLYHTDRIGAKHTMKMREKIVEEGREIVRAKFNDEPKRQLFNSTQIACEKYDKYIDSFHSTQSVGKQTHCFIGMCTLIASDQFKPYNGFLCTLHHQNK